MYTSCHPSGTILYLIGFGFNFQDKLQIIVTERRRYQIMVTDTVTYTNMYTGPENKYHVLEISISNITRYCLINFH